MNIQRTKNCVHNRDFIISELNLIQTLCKLLIGTIGLVHNKKMFTISRITDLTVYYIINLELM